MENNNIEKKTIYQSLNNLMNLDGKGFEQEPQAQLKQPKIIIKGNSPEEVKKKGLELEQKQALQNKFFKVTERGFQKALQYEAARLPAYMDFEGMEYYPIISGALDLFMEEATTIGNNGKMLNIYSNKDRIKLLLEDFFYNTANVNVNLPFWTRNTPIKEDSMIPLLDGTEITIKDLSERIKINPNEEIWTYSVQDKTNKIVAGKIIWCDLTRKDNEILKVTFDDGTYIETTPDHEYMLRNGSYLRADELVEGISLMPFYTLTSKEQNNIKGYEKVYDPSSNRYKFTHRMVANDCVIDLNEESKTDSIFVTHHVDFNKKNNHPSNLLRMTSTDHSNYHIILGERGKLILQRSDVKKNRLSAIDKYLRSNKRKERLSKEMMGIYPTYFNDYNNSELHDEHNQIRSNSMLNHWSNNNYREMVKDKMTIKIDDFCLNIITSTIKNENSYISLEILSLRLKNNSDFVDQFIKINNHFNKSKDLYKSINTRTLSKLIEDKTNKKYCDFILNINPNVINESNFKRAYSNSKTSILKKEQIINHKVLSIEKLTTKHDVYCMEVVGKNNEQDRHNFPVCSKDENGNYSRNGVFLSNCKYGDNFVMLYGEKGTGITHIKQMVNYEIERLERVQDGKPFVKFKERMTGDEFNSFEVAHFRLLGDDKFIPYGSSILNKIRRVFRQLIMAEDAMLTYRIIRAGEKRVFKIDVGNIDEDDIEEYMYKVATKFKKTGQVNPNDGQIDYRFNIMGNDEDYFLPMRNANSQTGIDTLAGACLSLDTEICLLDGRELQLSNIIDEFNSGKEIWTYSINPISGEIVPSLITWAGETRKNTEVIKLTLDNGKTITCTPDHKIPTRLGVIKEAKDLLVGESLWSFNKGFKTINNGKNTYETVYDHKKKKDIFTHRLVANYFKNLNEYNEFIYNDKYNSDDDFKLEVINKARISNIKTKNKPENKLKYSNNTKKLWKNERFYNSIIEPQKTIYSETLLNMLVDLVNDYGNVKNFLNIINDVNHEFYIEFINLNKDNKQLLGKFNGFTFNTINKLVKHFNYLSISDFKQSIPLYNHKIVCIEYLQEKQDTGTITVDGNERYHNYHNFPLASGVFVNNSNLNDINDIEYLRDNLFIGLGIPKPFLSFQDASGAGKNMAQYDIRFSKKVNRIQQAMIQELNKMAMIHLFLLGYTGEDLTDFTLMLTNPSTQQDLLKSELFREKAQTYTELTRGENGIAAMSHTQAKKHIFNMSEKEIVEDLKQQKMEKVVMQELADAPVLIKKTGLFADIDKRYGEPTNGTEQPPAGGEVGAPPQAGGMPPTGGEMGAPPMGGGMPPAGGEVGAPSGAAGGGGGLPPLMERINRSLNDQIGFDEYVENMIYGNKKLVEIERKNIISETVFINNTLNEKANDLDNECNDLLNETDKISLENFEIDEDYDEEIK